jgi:hypothetical protein
MPDVSPPAMAGYPATCSGELLARKFGDLHVAATFEKRGILAGRSGLQTLSLPARTLFAIRLPVGAGKFGCIS